MVKNMYANEMSEIQRKKRKKQKILIVALIIINIIIYFTNINTSNAMIFNSTNIYKTHDCGSLLKYNGITVKVSYVEYQNNGISYPAYCMDKTKPGAEDGAYDVNINKYVTDVGLWKVLTNGYPYKSLEQLGVETKEEAYTATKQAVYCYIHGNNVDSYTGIGDAGNRTLNALKNILTNAENMPTGMISNYVGIDNWTDNWKQEETNNQYISKNFSIESEAGINEYVISLSDSNILEYIKITDTNNIEKNTFNGDEEFKVHIPIKYLNNVGNLNINVNAELITKTILYGTAPNSGLQDYALTGSIYENASGNIVENYPENETSIIIIKQDIDTKEKLENVEFEILNENMETIYSNLKTDKEGMIIIEDILPGKYYIKETNTLPNYYLYEELIEVELKMNQEYKITVNNNKQEVEIDKIETEVEEVVIQEVVIKKLPVTGY